MEDDVVWEPEPIAEEDFQNAVGEANINRTPHDIVSGVVFKRAMNIKRVRYTPIEPAPEMPEGWQGEGEGVVRWIFSERPGTAEDLLDDRQFVFLQDVELLSGASTGQRQHPGMDTVIYVLEGTGRLYHRPMAGSPVIVRPLRPGDAVLIEATEFYSLFNPSEDGGLHLIVLGLERLSGK